MLLTRQPIQIHSRFQLQDQQQQYTREPNASSNDGTTSTFEYSALYPTDGVDLEQLTSYAAGFDAASPPSLMRSTDDVMHDVWLSHAKPATTRFSHGLSHNRDSSLGSLSGSGSGPASPASPAFPFTSNPHIAVTDDSQTTAGQMGGEYYQLAKSYGPAQDGFYPNYPTYQADPSAAAAYNNMLASHYKPKSERGLLPPPELSASSRSRPLSVASSVASADSPATPATGEPEERRSKNVGLSSVVPKFERTMTDVFGDELFNPNFSIETSSPSQQTQSPHQMASPSNEIFAQRLQAANSQHMSPISGVSRDRSPFRTGSPMAPSPLHDFGSARQPQQHRQQPRPIGFNTAQQMRERRKAEQDAQAMRQHLQGASHTGTPQTISPKDVSLEFPDDGEAHNFPLFPQGPTAGTGGFATDDQINKAVAAAGGGMPMDFYGGVQVPQQYSFVPVGQVPMHDGSSAAPMRADLARSASSAPSGNSGGSHSSISPGMASPQRPMPGAMRADGGTYSCTYHGCPERFDTPALLQKHKREGHRQGRNNETALAAQGGAAGMTSSMLNTQSGPHRCQRINPSTGKPCQTIFSRPYDLTRHEDTIHNARKQKVRCYICTEEKTFSRADALTRHFRVVHPDLEAPGGKHRRRALSGNHNH